MNRFQWNLRYPDATNVERFVGTAPVATALSETVAGPRVIPGAYRARLNYGGVKTQREFAIALDPRITAPSPIGWHAVAAIAALNKAIDAVVKLNFSGGEDGAVQAPRLHSHVGFLWLC